MAKKYENDKGFLIIEMSYKEAKDICNFGYGREIVCDNCNSLFNENDNIYYFAVLNRAMCKECIDDIVKNQHRYKQDIVYEVRHYNCYAKVLNLKEESINENDIKDYIDNSESEYDDD